MAGIDTIDRGCSMLVTEIPPIEWGDFCEQFSRQHRGWMASVGIVPSSLLEIDPLGAENQVNRIVREKPFREIAVEQHDTGPEIRMILGREGRESAYRVDGPLYLRFEESTSGGHRGLRIETSAGGTVLLRFRAAALPESLDGLGEEEF